MESLHEAIGEIARMIWSSVLEMEVVERDAPPDDGRHEAVAATVRISGGWNGRVELHCGAALARRAAGVLFAVAPERVSAADAQDAVNEIVSMVGGNLKALLPEPCQLGLPAAIGEARRGGDVRERLAFESEGSGFVVVLVDGGGNAPAEEGAIP